MKHLEEDIKKGTLKPVYIFHGSETFIMKEEIERLKNSLNDPTFINYSSFNGEDLKDTGQIQKIISLCKTLPFLSSRRLIVIYNTHKIAENNMQPIYDYAEKPSKTTTLVLIIENQKKQKGTPVKINKLSNTSNAIRTISFADIKGSSLVSWIQHKVTRQGKEIDRNAAYLLTDITDSNTWFISSEIEKLCMYVGKAKRITLKDVEEVVMRSSETHIYTFLDNLFNRKKDALIRLIELERSGTAILLLVSSLEKEIIRHYQILISGKKASESNIPPYVARKIESRKSLWTSGRLIRLLTDVREIEQKIKTGRLSQPFTALADISARYCRR